MNNFQSGARFFLRCFRNICVWCFRTRIMPVHFKFIMIAAAAASAVIVVIVYLNYNVRFFI